MKEAVYFGIPDCIFTWKISGTWNNKPTSSLNWRYSWSTFPLVINVTPCATSTPELEDRLMDLILNQTDGSDRRSLSTILNFVCARIYPHQNLRIVCAWHFHINARVSFFVENFFFGRPNCASVKISLKCSSTFNTGRFVTFSTR